jgi:hypothetical protein
MKKGLSSVLFLFLLTPLSSRAETGILVPAYFGWWAPDDDSWSQLQRSASQVKICAVFNPNSGPGTQKSDDYARLVDECRASAMIMIGYVPTGYGARPAADVKADVDTYFSWYAVDGIFFDEATGDAGHVAHYADLYNHVKSKTGRRMVVINPGMGVSEGYASAPASDVICTFESNVGYSALVPDPWTARYPAERFYHLPYQVPVGSMPSFVDLAVQRNAGWLYITDDGADGNPWDRLPAYWADEVARVAALNASLLPARPRRLKNR